MNSNRPLARSALRWSLVLLVAVLVGAWFSTPSYAADNSLKTSTPAKDGTVDVSPASLTLVFAAQVGPGPTVEMTCNTGKIVALGQPIVLADQVTVSVTLTSPAPKGPCHVSWRVTDQNLQPAGNGSFAFTVTHDTAITTSTSTSTTVPAAGGGGATAPTTTVSAPITHPATGSGSTTTTKGASKGPLALFRLLSTLGMAVVLGSLVVIAVAWPEGVEYILTVRFLRTAWVTALVGSYLYAGALATSQSGKGLSAALIPTGWSGLIDTTPGKAAAVRIVLVLASAYAVLRPERAIDPATQVAALVPPALAVVTLAFSRPEFGIIEYAAGAVHAVAMAVWIGGLLLLTRVVLAGPGDEDLVHAVRGFARISVPALWATVGSGAILLFRLDQGHLTTSHGLVLIVKTLFVSLMVFVGVASRQFINQRATRVDTMTAPLAVRLRKALGIEALVGIVVLVLTAWLLTLAAPGLAAGSVNGLQLGPVHRFQNASLGVDVSLRFSEKVGVNDVRIEVISPPAGLSGLAVDFLPPVGSTVNGMSIEPIPLHGTGAAALTQSDGFSLSTAGTWTVIVRVGNKQVESHDIYVAGGSGTSLATVPAGAGK
ncbi:MAG: copper resistance protein CopC [Actinomycetota bacterium]